MKEQDDLNLTRFEDFKKIPCWNINFNCFEGRNTTQATYIAGRADSYCLLVEYFEFSKSSIMFTSKEKINSIYFGHEPRFLEIFNFPQRMEKALSKRIDLEEAYWLGVEEVFNIYQALYNYTHPKLSDGMKVQCQETQEVYSIFIDQTHYRAVNSQGIQIKEIPNKEQKNYIFLDEMFNLVDVVFGKFKILE